MLRRLRFDKPMSRPVAMPQGPTFVLRTIGTHEFRQRLRRRYTGSSNLRIVSRLGPSCRPQVRKDAERDGRERPLNEHVDGGDEERVRKVVVRFGKHPLIWKMLRVSPESGRRGKTKGVKIIIH